ncbi:MAG: hypothetical protein JST16_11505 [Bdellovibrionales bacterium]|nr:hypothetical protein [Bdellovibrionales bacterium]
MELIQIAEFSLQTALQDLDRKLDQHATDVEHVWIYVRDGRRNADFSGLQGNFLLQTFSDRQSLLDKREQYRPDYLVCDVQGLENPQEIVDLVDRMGSGLVQIVLLGSASDQEKYSPLLSPVRCQWLLAEEGSDPAVLIKNNFANAR